MYCVVLLNREVYSSTSGTGRLLLLFHYTAVILMPFIVRRGVNMLNVSELTSFLFGRNFLIHVLDFSALKLQNRLNLKHGY